MTFVARTASDASTALPALKEAVRSLVPGQTFPTAATLEQLVDVTMVPRRFYLVLAGTLAAFALFLAAIGIYSLIASLPYSARESSACAWRSAGAVARSSGSSWQTG